MNLRSLALALLLSIVATASMAAAEKKTSEKTAEKTKAATQNVRELLPTDRVLGQASAPVLMIEYASLTCPHCANFHNKTLPDLKTKYIDTGKVRYVFRSFPLDATALRASMMAECEKDADKYYRLLTVLFKTQSNWASKQDYLPVLENIGKLAGMSGEEITKCLADKNLETHMVEQKAAAVEQLSIQATPSFVINGMVHSGAKSTEYFSGVIDEIVNKTPGFREKNSTEYPEKK